MPRAGRNVSPVIFHMLIARLLMGLVLTLKLASARAAEIKLFHPFKGVTWKGSISISGPLIEGDAQKLVSLMISIKADFFYISLNSPGGSVIEALKMAEIIREMRAEVRTTQPGICASACFFLWLAGAHRIAGASDLDESGWLGLHRPYLSSPTGTELSLTYQTQLMQAIATYLEQRTVPRRLIDIMMRNPSNQIYWAKSRDINEIGTIPPDLEELYIARCEYQRDAQYSSDKYTRQNACIAELQEKTRSAALRRLSGPRTLKPLPRKVE